MRRNKTREQAGKIRERTGRKKMRPPPLSAKEDHVGVIAFFSSPSSPLFSLLALLSCYVSSIERLSLHCSSNWKNYGFDKLVSQRNWHHLLDEKLGFWGTRLPWRNVAAGYTMDAWERWRIVCLAALSVEDIEDIYLFGTMITGLLLIGLGFALGYRRCQKNGNSCRKPHKACPSNDWSSGNSGQALRLRH